MNALDLILDDFDPARLVSSNRRIHHRFVSKVRRGDGDCLLWTGSLSPEGYGRFYLDGRTTTAQRAAYLIFVGPIADGLEIDHVCQTRACVNPSHLEAVTHRVNLLRSRNFAGLNAAKSECPDGHPYDDHNTKVRANGSRECRECRRRRNREAGRARRATARGVQ